LMTGSRLNELFDGDARLRQAHMPTSGTANRALLVTAANGDPGYGIVPITAGGTGATTAAAARASLDAAQTAHYHDGIREPNWAFSVVTQMLGSQQRLNPNNDGQVYIGGQSNRFLGISLVNNPTVSSDAREKRDIEDIRDALRLIMELRPKQFERTAGGRDGTKSYGFIAQDVYRILSEMGIRKNTVCLRESIVEGVSDDEATESQARYSIAYGELIAPLVAVVQNQQQRIEALEKKLKAFVSGDAAKVQGDRKALAAPTGAKRLYHVDINDAVV